MLDKIGNRRLNRGEIFSILKYLSADKRADVLNAFNEEIAKHEQNTDRSLDEFYDLLDLRAAKGHIQEYITLFDK